MTQLNQLPNLRVEDFPSEQSWINKLFTQLNPFIQNVSNLFSNNLDYSTNIKSVTKDFTIASTFQTFNFMWTFNDASPSDVKIIKATKGTQKTPTILLLGWSYSPGTKTISITQMAEINNSVLSALMGLYQFTIRATV